MQSARVLGQGKAITQGGRAQAVGGRSACGWAAGRADERHTRRQAQAGEQTTGEGWKVYLEHQAAGAELRVP